MSPTISILSDKNYLNRVDSHILYQQYVESRKMCI